MHWLTGRLSDVGDRGAPANAEFQDQPGSASFRNAMPEQVGAAPEQPEVRRQMRQQRPYAIDQRSVVQTRGERPVNDPTGLILQTGEKGISRQESPILAIG